MAILLTLLTFLLFISISYFRNQRQDETGAAAAQEFPPPAPMIEREAGFDVPRGYCFHPGHTWVLEEGKNLARVGMDAFGAELLGEIDKIDTGTLYRWVRQGEKLWTLLSNGFSVDMLSPVEGVVMAENPKVIQDPDMLRRDPYREGWVVLLKSPDLGINLHNLLRGPLVRVWMKEAVERLREVIAGGGESEPVFAQDGGMPVASPLARVEPELRDRLVREFFLTSVKAP